MVIVKVNPTWIDLGWTLALNDGVMVVAFPAPRWDRLAGHKGAADLRKGP